ncbi:hypothetical protein T03_1802 [Trichinella britovi]|uniref:Uncharacterized protein n=1 Tax=Trichinella britovi TaxID=45882 RepID=A0A0V1D9M6_TRIBR|nr:hypothetical protein T03_1802 [Trichinella britovi]
MLFQNYNSYSSTFKISDIALEDVRLNCVEHKISHTSFTLLQLKEKTFHNLHHIFQQQLNDYN